MGPQQDSSRLKDLERLVEARQVVHLDLERRRGWEEGFHRVERRLGSDRCEVLFGAAEDIVKGGLIYIVV